MTSFILNCNKAAKGLKCVFKLAFKLRVEPVIKKANRYNETMIICLNDKGNF